MIMIILLKLLSEYPQIPPPPLYFYTIRSMTIFLKVLNKVNFSVLTQT